MTTQDLNSLIKKNRFSSAAAALVVVLALVYFFRSGAREEQAAKLDQLTSESRRLSNNVSNASQLKEQYDAIVAANEAVEKRLVKGSELAKNQQYFYKIEADTGVKLTDLRPVQTSAPADKRAAKTLFSTVPYTCTVQGTYAQILAFLKRLEDGEHFQRITTTGVALAGAGADDMTSPDPLLTMTVSIEFLGQSS